VIRKYASLNVLEAWSGSQDQGLRKSAHRVAFDYEPRPGFIYVRSRMISSRTNDNHDTFPADEIEKGYRTFLGKPVFVNHHNASHRRARGVIVAVALHRDRNPDGTPDTWAEGLMEVDALRFPKLAGALLAGKVNRTSMGVDVEWSKCSACGNRATNPAEYCKHLPALKGKKIRQRNKSTGRVEETLIHEICAGLSFFENSLLVEDPADPTCYVLGQPDGRGLHVSPRSASANRGNGRFADAVSPGDASQGELTSARTAPAGRDLREKYGLDDPNVRLGELGDRVPDPRQAAPPGHHVGGVDRAGAQEPVHRVHADQEVTRVADRQTGRNRASQQFPPPAMSPDTRSLRVRQGEAGVPAIERSARPRVARRGSGSDVDRGDVALDFSSYSDEASVQFGPADHALHSSVLGLVDDRGMKMTAGRSQASTPVYYMPELEIQDEHFLPRTAAGEGGGAPAAKPSRKKEAGDHPFFRDHALHADKIVDAYHQTNDDEKHLGSRWYSDAHHVAGAIAGGNHALGAGLLSAYSPQTAWPINMFNASSAARGEPPGPGSGAMGSQQKPALRMLAGEHHSKVLNGPKTRAFAKLIEHGDDTPEDKASGNHQVVVDRHALSVAAGRRLSKDEGGKFPASQSQHYEHVSHMYRDAAKTLSTHYGREIKPHEVQAATWLRQQRMNQAEDSAGAGGGGAGASKGRVKTFTNGQERWQQHHREHHPGGIDEQNMHYHGRRVTAYGEERVPPQVDTLRMEECPVCGEHDVWSGDRCPVCGFTVPPSLFRDPDTGKAQEVRDQLDQTGEVTTGPDNAMGSDPDADAQLQHPDQLTPDGVPVAQGVPGQPPAQLPGQEEQAAGEEEQDQGAEDAEAGQEEQGEGQELENQGNEDQLAPAPQGQLACPACGQTFAPDVAAQPGVPCPACRQGSLEPAGGPQKVQDDPSERDDMPGGKTAAAVAQAQARHIAALTADNEVLTAQLAFLARAAGADQHLAAIRAQVMQRHADVLNPASPVPDPPEAPATETTEQALNPETMDDPSRPGTTPGSVGGVPAAQTTTAITPGVEIQTPPATNLIDVTAPVQGTNPSQDGGVPLEQRRIETDVRIDPDPLKAHGPGIGGQGDNGAAFPWLLGQGQGGQQKAASLQDQAATRTFASIRLAKLRVTAGLAQGDELAVAASIERDAALPDALIEHEIRTLSAVAPRQPAPRPQQRTATRSAPSLASVGAAHYASAASASLGGSDDSDLFID
jgi:rubrerythrin